MAQKAIPKKYFFLLILALLGFFALAKSALADYVAEGTAVSTNLLSGKGDVAQILSFTATTTLPASTTAEVQFSQDQVHWYDHNGIEGGFDALASGTNSIELRAFNWTTAFFYYRLQLATANASNTPTVADIAVNYSDTYSAWTPPWGGGNYAQGTVLSTNLLNGQGSVAQITGFKANATVPASTTLGVQFSQDQVKWYDHNGIEGGFDNLADGANNLDLHAFAWSGANLFYRAQFTTASATLTATLNDIEADFNAVALPYTAPWDGGVMASGTIVSADLLAGSGRVLSGFQRFGYDLSSLPAGASVRVQFSTTSLDWYSASGTLWGYNTLVSGNHLQEETSLDLFRLHWAGAASFYYKLTFSAGADGQTAALAAAALLEFPSPIGAWGFDEGQGTVVHDGTVNRRHGAITGASWRPESECVSGKCLFFDGSGDKVDSGDVDFK